MAGNFKLILIILIIISASCNRIENPLDGIVGSDRPSVVTTSPNDGSTTAPLFDNIVVIFNEAMDPATITTNTADTSCSGSLQVSSDGFATCVQMSAAPFYSSDKKIFIVQYGVNLTGNTNYQIRVLAAVTDTVGNNMLNTVTTAFTTVVDITSYIYNNSCGTPFVSIFPVGQIGFSPADSYPDGDVEGYEPIFIGFTFKYLSMPYDYIVVTTDGYATFDTSWEHWSVNSENLYTGVSPNLLLAPWWDNLDTGPPKGVYSLISGTAPNRILTIEWYDAVAFGTDDTFSFQLKLYEVDNRIEFVYGPTTNANVIDESSAHSGISDSYGGENHYINTFNGLTAGMGGPYTFVDFPSGSCFSFTHP